MSLDHYTLARGSAAWRWACAFPIGIVAVYAGFFLLFLHQSGPQDFDQFLVFHKLQYWNTELFGISKQWTPVMCGGLSLAGEPQVPFMSLSMTLSYLFEPSWGLRLATLIYFVLGWVGALLYSGLWFKQLGQRTLAAALFVGNGFFICRLGYGHIDFIPFLILPLVLWVLHRCLGWFSAGWSVLAAFKLFATIMAIGGLFALAIDGSPVAIIHLLLWIGLYAVVLAITTRSVVPVLCFGCAALVAGVLDAGYLWPMLQAQTAFPRRTPDSFTSALSLVWFAVLPVRGKVLPANGNGHELSAFIGPVLAILIWKYRHWLRANLPRDMKRPLVVVALASIVLGMGSLKALHVPVWLSPFDLLRPLPGFRSIGVTGRYWGFLALPLSLFAAAVLWRFLAESRERWKTAVVAGLALALQLGFQSATLLAHWAHSPLQTPAAPGSAFRSGPETIDYVQRQEQQSQGEFITPTRAVVNCYDMDEFIHADMNPGRRLIRRITDTSNKSIRGIAAQARFVTWSHIRVTPDDRGGILNDRYDGSDVRLRVILNQAYHPLWQAEGCNTLRSIRGNLILECPAARIRDQTIDLTFNDELSRVAADTSQRAWHGWLLIMGLIFIAVSALRLTRRTPAPLGGVVAETDRDAAP